MRRALALVLLLVVLAGCGSNTQADDFFKGSRDVERADLGDEWPLSVDRARIVCTGFGRGTIPIRGRHYAVTTAALDAGMPDIERVATSDPSELMALAEEACPG
jgi:hypothetical protein